MSITITPTLKVTATGIETVQEIPSITCDAIDVIDVAVPHGSADLEVEICPTGAEEVRFVSILSSAYPSTTGTKNLGYKIHASTEDLHLMSNAHVYMDEGQVGVAALEFDKLFFTNDHASADATVKIILGRNATP